MPSNISSNLKRLWLRERWSRVPGEFTTLLDSLQSQAFSAIEGTRNGSVIATAANGHSVQFGGGSTAEEFADFAGEAMDLYDRARAALIAAGTSSPTDAQIYVEMLDRIPLGGITSFTKDYSSLRTEVGA